MYRIMSRVTDDLATNSASHYVQTVHTYSRISDSINQSLDEDSSPVIASEMLCSFPCLAGRQTVADPKPVDQLLQQPC